MENGKKTDRRIEKTKKAIRIAFAKLLSEKDLNDITVKDIAEYAGINRKTFYNYYNGLYQVISEIEGEIAASFEKAVSDIDLIKDEDQPYSFFVDFTEMMNSDGEFYSLIINDKSERGIMSKIIRYIKYKALNAARNATTISDDYLRVSVDFVVTGMLEVYRSWFSSGRKMSVEDISKALSTICATGFAGMITEHSK